MSIRTSSIHSKLRQRVKTEDKSALCLDPSHHYSASEVENKSVVLNNEPALQGAIAGLSPQQCSLPKMFTPAAPPSSQYFHIAVDTVFKCLWKSFYYHGWRPHRITISVTNDLVRERSQLNLCQRS